MLNLNRIAIFALTAVLATGASAAPPTGAPADYGSRVSNATADRVITVTPDSRSIHVTNGETVTFDVNGKSFSWHVYTYPNVDEFDLTKIAPADVGANSVRVFVAPNPIYLGG